MNDETITAPISVDSKIFENFEASPVIRIPQSTESEIDQIAAYLFYIAVGVFALVFIPVACLVLFDKWTSCLLKNIFKSTKTRKIEISLNSFNTKFFLSVKKVKHKQSDG